MNKFYDLFSHVNLIRNNLCTNGNSFLSRTKWIIKICLIKDICRIVAKPALSRLKPKRCQIWPSPPFPRAVKHGSARNVKNPGQLALKLTTPPASPSLPPTLRFSRPLNQPLNIHSDRLRRFIYRKSFMSCNWCSRNSPLPPLPRFIIRSIILKKHGKDLGKVGEIHLEFPLWSLY